LLNIDKDFTLAYGNSTSNSRTCYYFCDKTS
jgi:hypothetical protein